MNGFIRMALMVGFSNCVVREATMCDIVFVEVGLNERQVSFKHC